MKYLRTLHISQFQHIYMNINRIKRTITIEFPLLKNRHCENECFQTPLILCQKVTFNQIQNPKSANVIDRKQRQIIE